MKIVIGKTSGFCKGVEYTIQRANEVLKENKKVYCLGEIVHNEEVIKDLEEKGLVTINNIEEVESGKVLIRAHGEVKSTYEKAKEKNIELIDLTCGKIKAIKAKIDKKKGDYFILIIGKKNHPESLGVKSFSGPNSYILEEEQDIKEMTGFYKGSKLKKMYIVSQTTFNSVKFDNLINSIKSKIKDEILVDKTICKATEERQNETKQLSKEMDKMIIVGGKNSSNAKELEQIAKENNKQVFFIQNEQELDAKDLKETDKIGIMAAASTPNSTVEKVIQKIKKCK